MTKNYWLVRASPSVTVNPSKADFSIFSKRKPTIAEDDAIVMMVGSDVASAAFIDFGSVTSVISSATADNSGYETKVAFSGQSEELSESIKLELTSALYSLEFIKDTSRAAVYLRRGYRKISCDDFETIIEGRLYVARTGYHLLLNSLPELTQRRFLAERAEAGDDPENYQALLTSLLIFIEERIFAAGTLLEKTCALLAQLTQSISDSPVDHLIVDVESPDLPSDSILEQGEMFSLLKVALSDASASWRIADEQQQVDARTGSELDEFTRLLMPQIKDDLKQAARLRGKK
jgi:HKD family nuclease